MSKVYAVIVPTDDVSNAERYGEIVHINHRYVYPDEITLNGELPLAFLRNMEQCLDDFDADEDYLLLTGDHLQLIQFVALLSEEYDEFRVLRWDRGAKAYFPVTIRCSRLTDPAGRDRVRDRVGA